MQDSDDFDFSPTLVGETISLRPLTADDFEAVYAAASDPLIWEQHPYPLRYRRDVFESGFWVSAVTAQGAFVITDNASGQVIGSSRYYEWDPAKQEVAIGFTFLRRSHWGGATNRELKRLMLEHAFRWARVVWFHVGSNNLRSRKAMEKIGGVFSHEEAKEIHGTVHVHAFYRIDAPGSADR
ncbi:MAG: family N-acetyltransferase [Moraxellaceae bacterium]|jgi:RimJ/RimL family protein N-acetyltransferase|nr:family N-acetyltransferase [Moraxellaceae bacterium]